MVASGVFPLTASGPSAIRSAHPASDSTDVLTSRNRANVVFHVCLVIGPPPESHPLAGASSYKGGHLSCQKNLGISHDLPLSAGHHTLQERCIARATARV